MNDLFEFPSGPSKPNHKQNSNRLPEHVPASSRVNVPSSTGKKDVQYARLSTDHHEHLRANMDILVGLSDLPAMNVILDQRSSLWGSLLGRIQTNREVLDGIRGKMGQRHPIVRRRKGQDLSIKQLKAFNDIIEAINALLGEAVLKPVPIPK